MHSLPVFLRLAERPVLLVGGGTVALRKARFLCRAGARVTVIAPTIDPALRSLLETRGGVWLCRCYRRGDLAGKDLVIAATPDGTVNAAVADEARARRLPVNVVDTPALCSFTFPAIVDRDPLLIAIGTGGASPVLARAVRRRLETQLPVNFGRLARFLGTCRDRLRAAISDESARRRMLETLAEGPIAEQVLAGNEAGAGASLEALLAGGAQPRGEVFLIGAGPGDPDLLTFRALRLLQRGDVILYDRLVGEGILELARRDAERLYVGKRRSEHSVPQDEINRTLVELARQGKCVVRLKGGDPFVFGRGGEEMDELARAGIPFQIVPGITAANAAACYAGIPLTHRDYAQSVRFVTGHTRDGQLRHQWEDFQSPTETLVFYMGLVGLPIICEQLVAHGRDPATPVALVEKASTAEQRVITGTLGTMKAIVALEKPEPPTLIIVGDVVRLAAELGWYSKVEGRPVH
ncbi:siroheme synthase CysG [Pseudohaliea rubra]|uniref:Siroheme synthase n=1 Tax=Pseudohaliea rubra DSM 19751 TaxID=1265313 RepID=A0A095VQ68_9GAMM|nr:siroheme synthase CysG [Pseudohaliea rubra]KGE03520.1 Siroheme synthase [Pseudohaliea rubra DSM 19751]